MPYHQPEDILEGGDGVPPGPAMTRQKTPPPFPCFWKTFVSLKFCYELSVSFLRIGLCCCQAFIVVECVACLGELCWCCSKLGNDVWRAPEFVTGKPPVHERMIWEGVVCPLLHTPNDRQPALSCLIVFGHS